MELKDMEILKGKFYIAIKDVKNLIAKPYLIWLMNNGYKARLFKNYIVYDKK